MALLALWNLGRGIALWLQADWLVDLPLTPEPRVRMAIALIIALAMTLLAIGLHRRSSWSRVFAPILLAIYGVYELGVMIAFSTQPPALLPILAYAAFAGFSGWALWRPSIRTFFQS